MSREARAARVREVWAAAWDRGEVDALDTLLGPGYRRRSGPADDGLPLAELKASIIAARAAFPDLTTTIDDIVAEDDRMVLRWHSSGRHTGSFLGVPATHREVTVSGATFARFEDDLIVDEFVTWDPRSLLTALGIISVGEDR